VGEVLAINPKPSLDFERQDTQVFSKRPISDAQRRLGPHVGLWALDARRRLDMLASNWSDLCRSVVAINLQATAPRPRCRPLLKYRLPGWITLHIYCGSAVLSSDSRRHPDTTGNLQTQISPCLGTISAANPREFYPADCSIHWQLFQRSSAFHNRAATPAR